MCRVFSIFCTFVSRGMPGAARSRRQQPERGLEGAGRLVGAARDVGGGGERRRGAARAARRGSRRRRWRSSRPAARRSRRSRAGRCASVVPARAGQRGARGRARSRMLRRPRGTATAPICWIVTRSVARGTRSGRAGASDRSSTKSGMRALPPRLLHDQRHALQRRRVRAHAPGACRRSPRARCRTRSGRASSPSRYIFTSPSPYQREVRLLQHAHADVAAEEAAGPAQPVGDREVAAQRGRVLAPEARVEQADRRSAPARACRRPGSRAGSAASSRW